MSDLSGDLRARLRLAAAISLLAALALTFALVSPTFWHGSPDDAATDYGVGLIRVTMCGAAGCQAGHLDLFAAAASWWRLGAAAFSAAAVAALAQIVVAVGALRGAGGRWYRPRWAALPALFAFSLGAVFVAVAPPLGLAVGPALVAYFGGAAAAIAGSIFLHPAPRPPSGPSRRAPVAGA
jgi:hypothetical protein